MLERAHDYITAPANAGKVSDPKFKFENFRDLGYKKGFLGIGNNERAFEFMRTNMERYGISLEQAARDLAQRRAMDPSAAAITDQQFRILASIVQNEVTLESNPATRPAVIFTNPVLKASAPLLGWSISKTHDNWESWRKADMTQREGVMRQLGAGLLPYLALVPMGMALGGIRNQYATVLNKKVSREDPTSFGGMGDSLSWVGSLGLAGDVYNSWLNRDTQRPFGVDHRVFFVSSILAAKSALQNWFEQGSADYSTVYRPLMQALGGGGYLHYAQIINNAMSLDNAEARVTARINAGNILRVAGREVGVGSNGDGGHHQLPMRQLLDRWGWGGDGGEQDM